MRTNHIKRGTVREDGKVFWVYRKGKEVWATKEQYDKRENTRKAYVRMCQQEYKKSQAKNYHMKEIMLANTIHPKICISFVFLHLAKKYGEANSSLTNIEKD